MDSPSQTVEQVALCALPLSLEVFKTHMNKALSSLVWCQNQCCFEQEAELET